MDSIFSNQSVILNKVLSYAKQDSLSHAIILSGDGDKLLCAKLLASSFLCVGSNRPCGSCIHCQKVNKNIHPDVIFVEDDSHKELTADYIRDIRNDVFIRPNEGACKVFIFPNCSQLNERDQNILLKIVEEGPSYACFIFCTDSTSSLLPTLRSRCIELKVNADAPVISSEFLPSFLEGICTRKIEIVADFLVSLEIKKIKRDELQLLFSSAWSSVADAILLSCGISSHENNASSSLVSAFSLNELNRLESIFKKLYGECSWNVGSPHVLGATISYLEDIIQ